MWMPRISGLIERRMLLNYRVDPDVLSGLLPAPFEPQIVDGSGVAGICLIRLRDVRPAGLPAWVGLRSENAAHRIAVEWNDRGNRRQGVYVPRRVTNSLATVLAGGRLFPGVHRLAKFTVDESGDRYRVAARSLDGETAISVEARATENFKSTLFSSLDAASRFFRAGACGYSPMRRPDCYEGLELDCDRWQATPLAVSEVHSSFFEDRSRFPVGAVTFDCALLMRNIPHSWRKLALIRGGAKTPTDAETACV